jgi:hypothetical protein
MFLIKSLDVLVGIWALAASRTLCLSRRKKHHSAEWMQIEEILSFWLPAFMFQLWNYLNVFWINFVFEVYNWVSFIFGLYHSNKL